MIKFEVISGSTGHPVESYINPGDVVGALAHGHWNGQPITKLDLRSSGPVIVLGTVFDCLRRLEGKND